MDIWQRVNKHLVHPELVRVMDDAADRIKRAHAGLTFIITEGDRDPRRQAELVRLGASKTNSSRHIGANQPSGKAEAVDIAAVIHGQISWHWPLYTRLATTIKESAERCGVEVEWGGDWKTFKDGPHWQLKTPPKLPKAEKA